MIYSIFIIDIFILHVWFFLARAYWLELQLSNTVLFTRVMPRKFIKYILYRFFPIFFITYISDSFIKINYPNQSVYSVSIVGFLYGVSVILLFLIKGIHKHIVNKLSLVVFSIIILTTSTIVSLFAFLMSYIQLPPFDNIFLFIIAISIIAIHILYERREASEERFLMKIVNSYNEIAIYSSQFNNASRLYNLDPTLLASVATLENISRPAWVRKIEYFLYKYTIIPIKTFGIMQVTSQKPLTDEESIYEASKIINSIASTIRYKKKDKQLFIYEVGKQYQGTKENGRALWNVYKEVSNLRD